MVDKLDVKLLQELQRDGRTGHVDLAKKLGVAEATVRKRIKKLQNDNIMKVIAVPNLHKLGYNLMSLMALQVEVANLRKIADNLMKKPNVCYLAFITGRYDMIAIVLTRSPEELSQFIEKDLSTVPGILRTETFVNLDILKGAWPLMDTAQLIDNLGITLIE